MQINRRLADFIRAEMEPILQGWEEFAKTIRHARYMGKTGLHDNARDMLLEIADDLNTHQSESEQIAKSLEQYSTVKEIKTRLFGYPGHLA